MSTEEAAEILTDDTPEGILGVEPGASLADIKKAFRVLIMKWHPDKNPHQLELAEEMSKKIIAAYTLLTA